MTGENKYLLYLNLIELPVVVGPAVYQPMADGFNPENCRNRQVFFGLVFLLLQQFIWFVSSSRTGKVRWTPVTIGNLPSSKSTETLWWMNWRTGADVTRRHPMLVRSNRQQRRQRSSHFQISLPTLDSILDVGKKYTTPNRSLEFNCFLFLFCYLPG